MLRTDTPANARPEMASSTLEICVKVSELAFSSQNREAFLQHFCFAFVEFKNDLQC